MTSEPYRAYRVDPQTGCWIWTGTNRGNGYGELWDKGRKGAHRAFYEHHVGPVPEGLVLDHLCRTTLCVNPAHLEPVTSKENILRGEGPPAQNARKTHCVRGHELAGDNLYIRSNGSRGCRECDRTRYSRNRAKRAGAPPSSPRSTHCNNGHELNTETLYVDPAGRHFCRVCKAEWKARRRKAGLPV